MKMDSDDKIHINIGRQVGAGGFELGQALGAEFGIKVYDKELITLAAKESGFDSSFFAKEDEKSNLRLNNSFSLSSFVEVIQTGFGANYMNGGTLFEIQSKVIRNLADSGSTIILGRCADYILRDYPNCLNIFVSAQMSDRIARIRRDNKINDADKLSDKKMESLLLKGDKKRASYYSEYSFKIWGASESYDLCVNTSKFTMDQIVKIVKDYIENRLFKLA